MYSYIHHTRGLERVARFVGRHVVVDRANCEPFQRQNWLKRVCRKEGVADEMVAGMPLSLSHGVVKSHLCGAVVVLHTSLDTCKSRVKEREDHFISEKNIKVVEQWHAALLANYPSCKGIGASSLDGT